MSSCVLLMINYLHENCQVTKKREEKLLFMSKEQSLLHIGIFFIFFNKAFCDMSQIIPSGRIALQQAVVEQVELQRQPGLTWHVRSPFKDLEKPVLQKLLLQGYLAAKMYTSKTLGFLSSFPASTN